MKTTGERIDRIEDALHEQVNGEGVRLRASTVRWMIQELRRRGELIKKLGGSPATIFPVVTSSSSMDCEASSSGWEAGPDLRPGRVHTAGQLQPDGSQFCVRCGFQILPIR